MKDNNNRGERMSAKVRQIVAEILRDEYPDISITLTDADSAGGLQFIRLHYQGDKGAQKRLDHITRMVRFELSARLQQKYTPDIRFEYDDTLERASRIDDLLNKIEK